MRKEKETYPRVRAIKPLFWKECRWCGDKFKWEIGYEILDYTRVNAHFYYSYCCSKCAKTLHEEQARAAIIKLMEDDHKRQMGRMPEIPKAPKKIIDTRFDKVNCITCIHFPTLEKSMMNGEMGHAAPRPCCVCFPHDFDVPCDRVKRCKYEDKEALKNLKEAMKEVCKEDVENISKKYYERQKSIEKKHCENIGLIDTEKTFKEEFESDW